MEYPIEQAKQAKVISVDIETKDPNLTTKGPGVYRKDGYILGVGIAFDNFSEYYNLSHYDVKQEEKEQNKKFLTELLGLNVPKLGANLLYDIDWLENFEGIKVNGKLHDIQVAEPLINEYARSYSLNSLATKYLEQGKQETELINWCNYNGYRITKSKKVQSYFYKMPSWLLKKYVTADIKQPLEIFKYQYYKLNKDELLNVYNMETDLYRLLLQMRKQGVRLDVPYVDSKTEELISDILERKDKIYNDIGYEINMNSTQQLAKLFDKLNIPYDRNEPTANMRKKGILEGNPSITKEVLESIDNPIIQEITTIRKLEKALSTFFINSFTESVVNGRCHSSFFPLRNDEYGTVSGRFSSANPNLQQIPARDKIIGPLCRSAFIPEENTWWGKIDFSQIEYRFIAHYAEGQKSEEIREKYNQNPDTDYHEEIMQMTGLERKPAKNLNFGLAYAMGPKTGAKKFGWDIHYAEEVFNLYHEKVPFVKHTLNKVSKVAEARGYVRTIMGRRARIEDKAFSYKMFNRLIQGSAADLMKKSMLDAYNAGIFNILIPHLTVHDELDFSIPKTKEGIEATFELKNIMETCIKLDVPVKADLEVGKNWHDVEEISKEDMYVRIENVSNT